MMTANALGMAKVLADLYDRGEILSEDWFDRYRKEMIATWKDALENNDVVTEDFLICEIEVNGGQCPVCGKDAEEEYREIRFRDRVMGRMPVYRLPCKCLDFMVTEKLENQRLMQKIDECGIPTAFRNVKFDDWDHSVDGELTESMKKMRDYATNLEEFLEKGAVLFGKVGRGKTFCSIALMREILKNTELSCTYESMADFTRHIITGGRDKNYEQDLLAFDVIFLDDLDKLSSASKWVQERLFSLFDTIFREGKTLIVTTNLETLPEMEEYFGDSGEYIVSRMTDKMEFIRFMSGEDYRKIRRAREERKKKSKK